MESVKEVIYKERKVGVYTTIKLKSLKQKYLVTKNYLKEKYEDVTTNIVES